MLEVIDRGLRLRWQVAGVLREVRVDLRDVRERDDRAFVITLRRPHRPLMQFPCLLLVHLVNEDARYLRLLDPHLLDDPRFVIVEGALEVFVLRFHLLRTAIEHMIGVVVALLHHVGKQVVRFDVAEAKTCPLPAMGLLWVLRWLANALVDINSSKINIAERNLDILHEGFEPVLNRVFVVLPPVLVHL